MYKHVMVDIETMGNKSRSAIISIGAVHFDMQTGETGKLFSCNVSLQSCIDAGLIVNADTILWWMQQDDKARQSLLQNTMPLKTALINFHNWLVELPENYEIWGNGARFDLGILDDAYHAIGDTTPWKFWQERDVRTLVSFNPSVKKSIVNDLPHDAISDCLYQIKYCSAIYNTLRKYSATESGLLEKLNN